MIKKHLTLVIIICSLLWMSACSTGSDDVPFTFGSSSPVGGASGSNVDPSRNPGTGGATGGAGGRPTGTGGSSIGAGGTGGAATGTGGASVGTGGSTSMAGTCEVDFNMKLILKIDDAPGDPDAAGHYDSPPQCCQYAGSSTVNNGNVCATMPTTTPGLLRSPSTNTDLYCCPSPGAADNEIDLSTLGPDFSRDYVDSLFCLSTAGNRHGGRQELAAARWKPVANQKARLRFRISASNACEVVLIRDSFPRFNIENSALTKSISLDMGRSYGSIPGHIREQMNPAEVVGRCSVTGTGSSYQINIESLNVYFLAQVFNNRTRCLRTATTDAARARCSAAFTDPYPADDAGIGSYQVLPGFNNAALELKTGTSTTPPINSTLQTPMTVTGVPLHFDMAQNKSLLKLVTTIAMRGTIADRDDNTGTGILMNQLDNAILSAELEGEVTRAGTTDPIRGVEDLRSCGPVPVGTGGTPGTGGSSMGTGGTGMGTGGSSAPGTGGASGGGGGGISGTETPLVVGNIRIDRIDASTSAIVLPAVTSHITFSELPARGAPETRLYRLSNIGMAPVTVNNLSVTDRLNNFRLFGPMQGPTFSSFVFPENPNNLTIPVSGGMGTNDVFFYINYGPQGTFTEATRTDTALLSYQVGATPVAITLTGTTTNESRGQLNLYIRDENRFLVTGAADKVIAGGHYYLPKNRVYSYRQDGSADREVYLYNDAPVGSDSIAIQGISLGRHMKFPFDRTMGELPEGCYLEPMTVMGMSTPDLAGLGGRSMPCDPMRATLNAGQGVKLGKIVFTPAMTTSRSVFSIDMAVKAPTGATARRPRVGGGDVAGRDDAIVLFALKGVEGAPTGHKGLRINRLLAGFQNKINSEFQKSLSVSSMTPGILTRYAAIPGSRTTSVADWKDVFTLESSPSRGALILDPVRGQMRLTRIATPLDRNASGLLDMNNPTHSSDLRGVRLYNSPGSQATDSRFPGGIEYYPQCKDATGGRCAFFYIYMGDYMSSTTPLTSASGAPALCQGKRAAAPSYNRTPDATVLNPLDIAQYNCIKDHNLKDVAGGYYDPVTGEVVLSDMILRLFAPAIPRLTGSNVDTSVRISFTTGCVTADMVPDGEARSSGVTVPETTRLDRSESNPSRTAFNDALIPQRPMWPERSPLSNYIGNTYGSNCSDGILHGRNLFMPDPTDTLDNDVDRIAIQNTFDIAGVGRLTSNNTDIVESNMYIVIKAEILD